ncbi:hypothetical protein QQS21_012569 [Conoideocrella luteorostrata]|uniref:Uncharacterized protein n=1 Tax=Conoideocrella luteorostrata TaxID=1105319 RepID=A0AAJ0CAX8_9HYPO|nr:hypothetical protein QQS21_012569 [Conoideocrella luteorostrata]
MNTLQVNERVASEEADGEFELELLGLKKVKTTEPGRLETDNPDLDHSDSQVDESVAALEFDGATVEEGEEAILGEAGEYIAPAHGPAPHKEQSHEVTKVQINVPFEFYGEGPYMLLVQHKVTKKIKQVVLFSYHSQHFFDPSVPMRNQVYHDPIWNASYSMAEVSIEDIEEATVFTQQAEVIRGTAGKSAIKRQATQFHLGLGLRRDGCASGVMLPEAVVGRAFMKTTNLNNWLETLKSFRGSWVGGIMKSWSLKSTATRLTLAWRSSAECDSMYTTLVENLHRGPGNIYIYNIVMAYEEGVLQDVPKLHLPNQLLPSSR